MTDLPPTFDVAAAPPPTAQVAAYLAARMCHDFISPASAIVSGLDLLEDPSAQDMKEEAMGLIASSARKLADLLAFTRVAFGASASAETFDARDLEKLARGIFEHMRADLDWAVSTPALNKPAARAVLNLAQMAGAALPTGGT
ncbi:MAG TPA: histidine phosphotransferase family protein, partial [Phenylobacterium sp.]